jgi:hypothetical protein
MKEEEEEEEEEEDVRLYSDSVLPLIHSCLYTLAVGRCHYKV